MNTYSSLLLRVMIAGLATQYIVGAEKIVGEEKTRRMRCEHPNPVVGSIAQYTQWRKEDRKLEIFRNQFDFDNKKCAVAIKPNHPLVGLSYCIYNEITFIRTISKIKKSLVFNFYTENLEKLAYKLTLPDGSELIHSDIYEKIYYSIFSDSNYQSLIYQDTLHYNPKEKELSITELRTLKASVYGKIKKAVIKNNIIYFVNGNHLLHYASFGEIVSIPLNSFISFESYVNKKNPLHIDDFEVQDNNTIKAVLTDEKKKIKKIIMAHYNEENKSWTTHEITEQH